MGTTYQPGQRDSRPWGTWEILALGPGYAVKRIVVRPGTRLSLQRHRHRAEHWIVVGGTAAVTRGRDTFPASAGENAVIGLGDVHRIANPGTVDLVFIEVQHGAHLDEADIERLEDDYGRE
jgi:mannose-6-phosphate isomerase-like protein (cupin superfamily)